MQKVLFTVLMAISLVAIVKARQVTDEGAASAEQREILKIEQDKLKAMLAGGSVAAEWFDRMEDDRLTYIAPFRGRVTKAQYVDQYRSGTFKVHSSDHHDFHVRVYNGNTAVMTYLTHNTNEINGQIHGDTYAAATDVFVKIGGAWRHVVHQVTLIPPK
jgi:uncharacterized protein DUF4440